MRRLNSLVSVLILVLFVIHGVAGGFQLMGVLPGGNQKLTVLAWIMAALLAVHVLIGIKLTADSIAVGRKTGSFYFRANALFWTRRISGFAMLIFVALHLMIFVVSSSGVYRLNMFAGPQLASQILLVLTLIVHVVSNIRPLSLSLGICGIKLYLRDIMLILSIVLLFTGAALVIYYLRWNVFWRI